MSEHAVKATRALRTFFFLLTIVAEERIPQPSVPRLQLQPGEDECPESL